MPNRLTSKVALVTGGASGFGLAISRHFAREGCLVYIGDLNPSGASALAAEYPSQILTGTLNVTSRADWDAAVSTIISKWGKIDILVNNAGTSYKNKPTLTVTLEEYQRTFDVNCTGIFHSVQAVFPGMIERGGGVCLNISSCGADRPRQGLVWYNATKGAVSNATKGLALEYGPNKIRVNSICPLLSGTGL
jgi:NAD(P)-dependent dehydrogenase (short-subunit alcohol dehydrogenase family)